MILSGREIVRHMGEEIIIDPFDPKKVNPNSYNLTLSDELMVYDNHELDMKKKKYGYYYGYGKYGKYYGYGKKYGYGYGYGAENVNKK